MRHLRKLLIITKQLVCFKLVVFSHLLVLLGKKSFGKFADEMVFEQFDLRALTIVFYLPSNEGNNAIKMCMRAQLIVKFTHDLLLDAQVAWDCI